jgi:hypothetical protein
MIRLKRESMRNNLRFREVFQQWPDPRIHKQATAGMQVDGDIPDTPPVPKLPIWPDREEWRTEAGVAHMQTLHRVHRVYHSSEANLTAVRAWSPPPRIKMNPGLLPLKPTVQGIPQVAQDVEFTTAPPHKNTPWW